MTRLCIGCRFGGRWSGCEFPDCRFYSYTEEDIEKLEESNRVKDRFEILDL
jgi:hypothetical protein